MHVRFASYRRSVVELRRDETDSLRDCLLPLSLVTTLVLVCKDYRHSKGASPRAKVLRCVRKISEVLDVLVHVAGTDVVPVAIALVAKQSLARRHEQRADE